MCTQPEDPPPRLKRMRQNDAVEVQDEAGKGQDDAGKGQDEAVEGQDEPVEGQGEAVEGQDEAVDEGSVFHCPSCGCRLHVSPILIRQL